MTGQSTAHIIHDSEQLENSWLGIEAMSSSSLEGKYFTTVLICHKRSEHFNCPGSLAHNYEEHYIIKVPCQRRLTPCPTWR